jgi:hypothetical protein
LATTVLSGGGGGMAAAAWLRALHIIPNFTNNVLKSFKRIYSLGTEQLLMLLEKNCMS